MLRSQTLEETLLRATIKNEFQEQAETENPHIDPDTWFFFVPSSRHTVSGEHDNCAIHSMNYKITPISGRTAESISEDKCDQADDFMRLEAAIKLANQLTAERASKSIESLTRGDYKKHAPFIIYNGWPTQNRELKRILNSLETVPKDFKLPFYPSNKFKIYDLKVEQVNTVQQFINLDYQIQCDPDLRRLKNPSEALCLVTHGYVAPRTKRIFTSAYYEYPLNQLQNITFHLIDRSVTKRPCAKRDKQGEIDRIVSYTPKGWLGEPKSVKDKKENTPQNWTPQLHQRQSERLKNKHDRNRTMTLRLNNTQHKLGM